MRCARLADNDGSKIFSEHICKMTRRSTFPYALTYSSYKHTYTQSMRLNISIKLYYTITYKNHTQVIHMPLCICVVDASHSCFAALKCAGSTFPVVRRIWCVCCANSVAGYHTLCNIKRCIRILIFMELQHMNALMYHFNHIYAIFANLSPGYTRQKFSQHKREIRFHRQLFIRMALRKIKIV